MVTDNLGGEMGRDGRIAVWVLLFVLAGSMAAAEPVGDAVLEASWVADQDATPGRRLLRVTVRPLVTLPHWNLLVSSPTTFDVRHEDSEEIAFRSAAARAGTRAIRAEMRPLAVGETTTLDFEVLFPPDGAGMLSFVVEETAGTGRVLAAVGVTARPAGPPPQRRLGAIEYPANVLPAEGPH